ncbi:MAG: phosphoglucosamine mutase [Acidimicrobiia bacterium BACL6 MAG-120924-bin43]|uniref:Phosphoglucosamine mutase n=1 Tax=Acidimicrobiia bacterium BACL6 MAG-120924-bin43 TaxID=1655583 RepID=A0A0R2Q7U7_9ACTN|nr:MAG: phosphoglucosamine mutase [Acidimicrobiia bacterium BACL6 MAG-120924-bin43]
MPDLNAIVKAYDIRGIVPEQLDASAAYAFGVAFAKFTNASSIVVAHDMRPSGPELLDAFQRGAIAHGVDVTNVGLASSDLLYYASGKFNMPGAMFTASHNPAQYNGIKCCLAGARSIGIDNGLREMLVTATAVLDGKEPTRAVKAGTLSHINLLSEFVDHVVKFIQADTLRPLRIVADTANGMGGLVVPAVFERLSAFELEVMYGELDGTFPNHPADPLQPANQRDLQARVLAGGFDVGLAFDGDADRVFVVDEKGRGMSGSTTTALLATRFLRTHPGATILYNLICSRAVPEVIAELGGKGIRTKNGHSFMKQIMDETGAVFAGEHSGHYYFADNYRADSGLIATMGVLGEMCHTGKSLSQMREPLERYASSGEINTTVDDIHAVIERIALDYSSCTQDRVDGLTVDCGSWWFNVRASNTEPLLRLNLEASTRDECDEHVVELLASITA